MAEVIALPARGDVFFDLRGGDRALRVSWHPDDQLVVLSLWRDGTCTATFRMPAEDVPHLVGALVDGLAECIPPSTSVPQPGPRPVPGQVPRPVSAYRPRPAPGGGTPQR